MLGFLLAEGEPVGDATADQRECCAEDRVVHVRPLIVHVGVNDLEAEAREALPDVEK